MSRLYPVRASRPWAVFWLALWLLCASGCGSGFAEAPALPTAIWPTPIMTIGPRTPTATPAPTTTPAAPPTLTAGVASAPEAITYTIQAGDTMLTIASRHNLPIETLLAANPNVVPEQLQIGQVVTIPGSQAPAAPTVASGSAQPAATTGAATAGGEVYQVQSGDTLNAIANRFGMSVEELLAANPDVIPEQLQIGQSLTIPENSSQ